MYARIQTSKVRTFNQQTLKYSKYNVWSNSGIKGGCLRKVQVTLANRLGWKTAPGGDWFKYHVSKEMYMAL